MGALWGAAGGLVPATPAVSPVTFTTLAHSPSSSLQLSDLHRALCHPQAVCGSPPYLIVTANPAGQSTVDSWDLVSTRQSRDFIRSALWCLEKEAPIAHPADHSQGTMAGIPLALFSRPQLDVSDRLLLRS